MDEALLTLRGHHLGCVLAGFRSNSNHPTVPIAMEWLRSHPEGTVKVIVGPDDICLPCPEWNGNTCLRGHEELNQGKDRKFLDILGMKDGETLSGRKLFARLKKLADLAFFREICPKCNPDECAEATADDLPF